MEKEKNKDHLLEKYRYHEKDTGSVVYQIILLLKKIKKEKLHLTNNKKDIPTTRALLKNNSQKRRFLWYLKKKNVKVYQELKNLKTEDIAG